MTYLVIGKDYADGLERRLQQREAHLAGVKKLKEAGKILYAVAFLEGGIMKGSVMVMNFGSEEELKAWKDTEPYLTGRVWETVEITECAVPPLFL